MSGSRPVNGNRQRNLSVTSNTSSSSYKDNSSVNYRNSDHVPDHRRTSRSSRTSSSTANANSANGVRDNNHQFLSSTNSSFRDFQRPTSLYDSGSALNNPSEGEHREMQEKMRELQQKKWQYENAMSQLQQMHSFSDEPTPNATRAEMTNNAETVYTSISNRARKLQEAQQRLIQLQELMQNVSIDLDYNPYTQQNEEKNSKPKDFPLDFLRNVSSSGPSRTPTIPRINPGVPRHLNKGTHQQQIGASSTHLFSPQNNLSHDSLGSPKRYSTSSQVNGSLLDVFAQGEPSFDSSNEEAEETRMEEVNGQDDHSSHERMHSAETSVRNGIRLPATVPIERLDRIENQLERTNSLCELMVVEQRRLALVTESLLSAVSNLQFSSRNAAAVNRNASSSFSLSGLPVNSSWNDSGSDFHVLAQAVSTCCHMLTQLQRDLATVQLSLESNPQHPEASGRTSEVHHNPFRDPKAERSSASAYECAGMDRFDPQVTLNNRVPPGTRTNNYWDNFRSYSRQNLLSSGPSNVNVSDHQQAGLSTEMSTSSLLHPTSQQIQATSPSETNPRNPAQPPSRRTKRKINKGQRQVEIGVHCPPHADNRVLSALAYGLLSVRGQGGNSNSSNSSGVTLPEVNARNLNHQQQLTNEVSPAPVVVVPAISVPRTSAAVDAGSNNNKVVKDTSTLKYSGGARPKENRRAPEPNVSSVMNVNLLAERESEDKPQQASPGLEAIVRVALTEHAARPQFLSQLLQLLHKFDSDPLREMALNALHECATSRPSHQSELSKVFINVVGHHRELTPNLLETFLNAVQLPEESDHEEGAASLHQQSSENTLYMLRQALTPFLFRRLGEVQDLVVETLNKMDTGSSNPNHSRETNAAVTVGVSAASTSGQEDDLAEADQSCDQSCDGLAESSAGHDESEMNQRHSAVGLDEVPTRLMSVLSPPVWSSARSANQQVSQAQQPAADEATHHNNSNLSNSGRTENVGHWFPEDSTI